MSFAQDARGTTAIEYALIAGGVALAIITIVYQLGTTVSGMYQSVSNGFH